MMVYLICSKAEALKQLNYRTGQCDDYSYVAVGHPDEKCLFIMVCESKMETDLLVHIIEMYRRKRYNVTELVS